MKLFCLSAVALGVAAKDIKQKMMENRLKFDRDVVIHGGDEGDDEEWDPWDLEDEELQSRLRKLVSRMDHNRDGFVDMEELTSWTFASVYNMEGKDARGDFPVASHFKEKMHFGRVMDFLHRTHIADEEDADIFDPNHPSENMREYNKMYNRDKARFDAADIDGDEKLTEQEFVLFKNPLRDEAVKTAVLAECLSVVDTDKDGKISLQEYLNDWHVPPNKNDEDFIELETDRFNDEYDRNKDGFLTGDELLFWLSPDNTEIAIDEAEHLIDMCDEDEDERLTPEEIVENHDLWVDSDATEYGAQLRHYDEL